MPRLETAYAKLVDRLVADLVTIARAVAKDHLQSARAARKMELDAERKAEVKAERAAKAERARAPKVPKVSARLQRALERAEEARKRAAERRAQAIAARAARSDVRRPEAVARTGRAAASASGASVPAAPPPLFVHKRSRDGSIQTLERGGESAPPPA
jgi:hypothetical protein